MERDEAGAAQGRPLPPALPGRPVLPAGPLATSAARCASSACRASAARSPTRPRPSTTSSAPPTSTRAPTPTAPTGSSASRSARPRSGSPSASPGRSSATSGASATIEPADDGGVVLRAPTTPTPASSSPGSCGLGEHARVSGPPELADEVDERAALLADRHERAASSSRARRPAPPRRGRARRAAPRRRRPRREAAIRPERFARLVTLASILIEAGRAGAAACRVEDVCERLQISEAELREDVNVLNVVNFGGGSYVLYAEVADDGSIEVDPEPYSDNFARPARLLPVEAKALVAAIDLIGEHLPEGALTSAREKIVAALGSDPMEQGLQIAAPAATTPRSRASSREAIAARRLLRARVLQAQRGRVLRAHASSPTRSSTAARAGTSASSTRARTTSATSAWTGSRSAEVTRRAVRAAARGRPGRRRRRLAADRRGPSVARARASGSRPERARWAREERTRRRGARGRLGRRRGRLQGHGLARPRGAEGGRRRRRPRARERPGRPSPGRSGRLRGASRSAPADGAAPLRGLARDGRLARRGGRAGPEAGRRRRHRRAGRRRRRCRTGSTTASRRPRAGSRAPWRRPRPATGGRAGCGSCTTGAGRGRPRRRRPAAPSPGSPTPQGGDAAALAGALDCDVGLWPLTNLMPVRRLGLLDDEPGVAPRDVLTAWVGVPALTVDPSPQRYVLLRTDPGRATVRFSAGDFAAELTLDADGLVVDYPELAAKSVDAALEVATPQGLHGLTCRRPGARAALVLGHGAGGGVTAPDLVAVTAAAQFAMDVAVALVEQPYRVAGRRSPPRRRGSTPPGRPSSTASPRGLATAGHSSSADGLRRAGGLPDGGATGAAGVLCLAFPLQPPRRRRPRRAGSPSSTPPRSRCSSCRASATRSACRRPRRGARWSGCRRPQPAQRHRRPSRPPSRAGCPGSSRPRRAPRRRRATGSASGDAAWTFGGPLRPGVPGETPGCRPTGGMDDRPHHGRTAATDRPAPLGLRPEDRA